MSKYGNYYKDFNNNTAMPQVPTPNGWVRLFDLQVGTEVYDGNGEVCRVTVVSGLEESPTVNVRVGSSRSAFILPADMVGVWEDGRTNELSLDREFSDLVGVNPGRVRLQETDGFVGTEVENPVVDPYMLGQWMGDGRLRDGDITTNADDADVLVQNAADLEYFPSGVRRDRKADAKTVAFPRLTKELKSAGYLTDVKVSDGGRKHIPDWIMAASREQRYDFLAGMIDSDGTASTKQREVRITTAYSDTADRLKHLARGLGFAAYVVTKEEARRTTTGVRCDVYINLANVPDDYTPEKLTRLPRYLDRLNGYSVRPLKSTVREVTNGEGTIRPVFATDSPTDTILVGEYYTELHDDRCNNQIGNLDADGYKVLESDPQESDDTHTFPARHPKHVPSRINGSPADTVTQNPDGSTTKSWADLKINVLPPRNNRVINPNLGDTNDLFGLGDN